MHKDLCFVPDASTCKELPSLCCFLKTFFKSGCLLSGKNEIPGRYFADVLVIFVIEAGGNRNKWYIRYFCHARVKLYKRTWNTAFCFIRVWAKPGSLESFVCSFSLLQNHLAGIPVRNDVSNLWLLVSSCTSLYLTLFTFIVLSFETQKSVEKKYHIFLVILNVSSKVTCCF